MKHRFSLPCLVLLLLASHAGWGHGFGGSGLLHPLTGFDHLLAMLAVGTWSAQLGGKALYVVPGCFMGMMLVGGIAGVSHVSGQYIEDATEVSVGVSVILLGLEISRDKQMSWLLASIGVGLFGFSHGLAHGLEITQLVSPLDYIAGFLITTLGLHLVGGVGGLLILEESRGRTYLRRLGALTAVIGFYLLIG